MSQIVKLVQGTPEWHEHRAKYRNASETAIVMGDSPWMTPYQLWELRTGRREAEVNAAMLRGTALEPAARAAYEELTGHIMQPLVLVDGQYSASLDGQSFDGRLIVEIKCPVRGRESSLWKSVAAGELPIHYSWQVEHQLMVSKAEMAHLYVFDGDMGDGLLQEIRPQPERWEAIHEAWERFMECLSSDSPPPLSDRDKVIRNDDLWQAAADAYLVAKAESEAAGNRLDAAKQALLELAKHPSESGNGVTVTRYWKQGAIDYKRVPGLTDVNLNQYRKKGSYETRVSVSI